MKAASTKRTGIFRQPAGEWLGRAAATLVALTLAPGLAPLFARREDASRNPRLALIRGLAREIAVAKVGLPRGKTGIFVDAQGKVDQEKANAQARQHGVAIRPGTPVQITKVSFKSDRIVLEINGGGKKGRKWYERIQIGVGGTAPIVTNAPAMTYGSYISLAFTSQAPELTVEQAKQRLSAVLDFERHSPTTLYSPQVPPDIKEAIKNHQVIVGMDRDAVLSSKGPPDRKVREEREGVEQEDWIYGLPPKILFVTFDGDVVVAVRDYRASAPADIKDAETQ